MFYLHFLLILPADFFSASRYGDTTTGINIPHINKIKICIPVWILHLFFLNQGFTRIPSCQILPDPEAVRYTTAKNISVPKNKLPHCFHHLLFSHIITFFLIQSLLNSQLIPPTFLVSSATCLSNYIAITFIFFRIL